MLPVLLPLMQSTEKNIEEFMVKDPSVIYNWNGEALESSISKQESIM